MVISIFVIYFVISMAMSDNGSQIYSSAEANPNSIDGDRKLNEMSLFTTDHIVPIIIIVFFIILVVFVVIAICYICYCYRRRKLYEQIPDESSGRPIGFYNDRETCYMNSMFQALASSEILIEDLDKLIQGLQNKKKYPKFAFLIEFFIKEKGHELILLRDLLRNINNSESRRGNIKQNTKNMKRLMNYVQWNRESQQDTFQLLSAIINAIQKDIQEELEEQNVPMPPKFKLLHTFTENSNYNKDQLHLGLALPLCGDFGVKPGVELRDLMDGFFRPSLIDNGPNETQMYMYESAPEVLILHIQANELDPVSGSYKKPEYYIKYQETMEYEFEIQMKKDGSEKKKEKVEYKLTAVVHHMGGIGGGHYVCYRIHNGLWYLTSDEQVEQVSFDYQQAPYVMVYERIHTEM